MIPVASHGSRRSRAPCRGRELPAPGSGSRLPSASGLRFLGASGLLLLSLPGLHSPSISGLQAQEAPREPEGLPMQETVAVPETDGPPVLLDGTFSPGEWADAVTIDADGVILFLKQEKGHVLLGVRCRGLTSPVVDLFVEPLGGEIHQLHASAQLGERAVPSDGSEPPPFTWGRSPSWYANEVRWDEGRRRQLINEGMERGEAQMETLFPYDGFEFQIRRDKFGKSQWRIRLEVWSAGGNTLVFPTDTQPGNPRGWLVLDLGAGVLTSPPRPPR